MSADYFLDSFGGAEPEQSFDPGVMDTPEEVVHQAPIQAPAPIPALVGTWSWTPSAMLWTAGGVLALGFAVWFLMSYNAARVRALAEEVTSDE